MPTKILHILDSLNVGGLENGLVNLVNCLANSRFYHIICVLREIGIMADRIKRKDAEGISNTILEAMASGVPVLATNLGGNPPIAFRAGNFAADENTLVALKKNGFLIDSSYNAAYEKFCNRISENPINDCTLIKDIWEFPITNFVESAKLRPSRFMPLDINGASFHEIKYALCQSKLNGPHNIIIILHSFSFIRPHDVQYNKLTPRWHVISRFKQLCQFLYANSNEFTVRTLGSIDGRELRQTE